MTTGSKLNMFFKNAKYVGSFVKLSQCPKTDFLEFAFVGRSNVGKSSLINLLTHSTKLAKISRTPGKTQTINYFLIDERWYLVDLPGYGYAKVSKNLRHSWGKMIANYIANRESLFCLFVLIDSRISPQNIDREFIIWLGEIGIPFVLVFTKADKYPARDVKQRIEDFKTEMLESWESLPQIFITSATKKKGANELVQFIDDTLAKEATEER